MIKISIYIFILGFITACGYQLRGAVEIPEGMENIYVQNASKPLYKQLKDVLKFSAGKLVTTSTDAGVVLQIQKEKLHNRVLAVSTTGKANQFEFDYQVLYALYDATGKVLMDAQRIEIKRDYFNDQEDILGQTLEEEMIRKEIYIQAVQSILRRYRIALEKSSN